MFGLEESGCEEVTLCQQEGCTNVARRAGNCWGHHKRRFRHGKPVSGPLVVRRNQPPSEILTEAAIGYAAAEDEEEYRRCFDRLRRAAVRYANSLPSAGAHRSAHRRLRRTVMELQMALFPQARAGEGRAHA